MRRLPALVILLALSPKAWGPGTWTVCPGPSSSMAISVPSCDYPSVNAAMADTTNVPAGTTLEVYAPDSGAAYAPVTLDRAIWIRGLESPTQGYPVFAASGGQAAITVDCSNCQVDLTDIDVDLTTGNGLVYMSSRTALSSTLDGVYFFTELGTTADVRVMYVPEGVAVTASDGGIDTTLQGVDVNGGSLDWTRGLFQSEAGFLGRSTAGRLRFISSSIRSPGTLPGFVAEDTGSVELTEGTLMRGQSVDGTESRTTGTLIQANGGTVKIANSTVEDGYNADSGGGLVKAGAGSVLVFSQSTLQNGTSDLDGGLVYAEGAASFSAQGVHFLDGIAGDNGGGVKLINVGSASFTGGSFTRNDALSGHGGGIGAYNSPVTLGGVTFAENHAGTEGGGVYLAENSHASIEFGTRFDLNAAVDDGGALYALDSDVAISDGDVSDNDANFGGALSIDVTSGLTRTLRIARTAFRNNTSALTGGAISSDVRTIVQIEDSRFEENIAGGAGGALSTATSDQGYVRRTLFCRNSGSPGGAIAAFDGVTSTTEPWSNLVFFANDASEGGAIYLDGGRASLAYGTLAYNLGERAGGALMADWGGQATVTDAIVAHTATSVAVEEGANSGPAVTIDGVAFGNAAGDLGSGVSGSLTVLGENPVPNLNATAACADLDWAPSTAASGDGATAGGDPFQPPANDADADQDGYTVADGDCDDDNADVNPGADELCDAGLVDENCDGSVNGADSIDALTGYFDGDADGYGTGAALTACVLPEGYVEADGDCNDADDTIHPEAAEVCDDLGVDEDCDGAANDADPNGAAGRTTVYLDADGDGFGTGPQLRRCDTTGYAFNDLDCDDSRDDVNPEANEVCDELDVDEDCDGGADDLDIDGALQQTTFWVDGDGDGYGAGSQLRRCDGGVGYADNADDCNDEVASISPAGQEICDELGVDEDCDGLVDDADDTVQGQVAWYPDKDLDGYGDDSAEPVLSCGRSDLVDDGTDCDDTDGAVHPGATEVWYDAVDDDCDGNLADQDLDGFPSDLVAGGTDCDDGDDLIHPDAVDLPGDTVDQDCDGTLATSSVGGGCGCASTPGPAALVWLVPAVGLIRRRRR